MVFSIVLTLYVMTLLFSSGMTSLIMIALFLELLSWVFVFILPKFLTLSYLMIQSYFFILILATIFWFPSMVVFSLIVKLGLPPVHMWFVHISKLLSSSTFLFMATLHKLFPIFVLSKGLFLYSSLVIISMLVLFSSYLVFKASLFSMVLIYSSMVHSGSMVLGFLFSKSFSFFYWVVYSLLLSALLKSYFLNKLSTLVLGQNSMTSLVWLALSGMPPFVLFWLKFNIFLGVIKISILVGIILVQSSILTLTGYYWAVHVGLVQHSFSPIPLFGPVISMILIFGAI